MAKAATKAKPHVVDAPQDKCAAGVFTIRVHEFIKGKAKELGGTNTLKLLEEHTKPMYGAAAKLADNLAHKNIPTIHQSIGFNVTRVFGPESTVALVTFVTWADGKVEQKHRGEKLDNRPEEAKAA
jgi:hypothetical protein